MSKMLLMWDTTFTFHLTWALLYNCNSSSDLQKEMLMVTVAGCFTLVHQVDYRSISSATILQLRKCGPRLLEKLRMTAAMIRSLEGYSPRQISYDTGSWTIQVQQFQEGGRGVCVRVCGGGGGGWHAHIGQ